MKTILFLLIALCLSGCQTDKNLTLNDVKTAFEKINLPLKNVVIYDEQTDPNKLLKRPGQYVEKMNFTDSRIKEPKGLNCSVEVFSNSEDMDKRKKYLETVTKSVSFLVEYAFSHRNVLIRIDKELSPDEAEQYNLALKSLN